MISLVVDPINAVLKLWNNLSIPGFTVKLPSVDTHIPGVGKVGGETLGWGGFALPDVDLLPVPKLALGGIAMSPTLALIGEAGPEAVVPLDRARGIGGVTVNLHFAKGFMTGSPRDIARELAMPIADALERLGPGTARPTT